MNRLEREGMCGIAGVVDEEGGGIHRERLEKALLKMSHRGPDGDGVFLSGPCILGHRRLAIIDIEGGAQPMVDRESGVAIVFNGEIYNYKEIRASLKCERFHTNSDTEVLLRAYLEHGEGVLAKLRGMFAFAIWDPRDQKLFGARDRFGEKPFYYTIQKGRFFFASELPALRVLLGRDGELCIDRDALNDYLALLYIPAPRTIFRGIFKLEARTAFVWKKGYFRTWRYEALPFPGTRPSGPREEVARELRPAIEEAVRLQLRSDVPVGALLSGGIDSSTVVAIMARELGGRFRTYTVGFGRADDEFPYARLVAERYGTEHTEIRLDENLEQRVERTFRCYGEPFADSSAVPTVAVYEAVSRHAKVVLTGDGGDELFAGYGRYQQAARWPKLSLASWLAKGIDNPRWMRFKAISRLRRGLALASQDPTLSALASVEVFSFGERRWLLGKDAAPILFPAPLSASMELPDAIIWGDFHRYLPDDLMVKTDTASMASSVESRSPFLDPELVRLVAPLSWRVKQSRFQGKTLLRAIARPLLPEAVLRRRKRGFGSPVDAWLSGPLRTFFLDELFSSGFLRDHLEPSALKTIAQEVSSGRGNPHQGWSLFALALWARFHF
ncbi:MAG: asparagine synthase (glutamine-hydrolyzing) [Sandaracinaceae bacterium]|nr:asparagine synthase (glutamine-hydrolyzing) [Sandaracinaceae bacterium]